MPMYQAAHSDAAQAALDDFEKGEWGRKFPIISQMWRRQWNPLLPLPPPHLADDREFSAPFTLFKIIQSGLSRVAMGGLVNGPERGGSGLRSFQWAKDSELRIKWTAGLTGSADRRLGSVRKAMQPIDDGNEKIA